MLKGFISPISALLLVISHQVLAMTPAEALQAYKNGDYSDAYTQLKTHAEQGHSDAQYYLGSMYHEGKGVTQDDARAVYWFRAAANQGNARAQFSLGNAYKNGRGMEQDDWMALNWWKRSALQSYPPAQYNVGIALLFGRGTAVDEQSALDWLNRAANSGYTPAKRMMSQMTGKSARDDVNAVRNYHSHLASGEWVRERPAKHYTIQMMAGPSRKEIKRFWQSSKTRYPAAIFRFKHGQDAWHGLVVGDFDSPSQARRALQTMSINLREKRPWIRRFDSLQKMLVDNNQD